MKGHRNHQDGFVLVSVLLITTFLLTVAGGLLVLTQAATRYAKFQEYRLQAFLIAESGINDGLARIRANPSIVPTTGSYDYTVHNLLGDQSSFIVSIAKDEQNRVHINSEGHQNNVVRKLTCKVGSPPLFPNPVNIVDQGQPFPSTTPFPTFPNPTWEDWKSIYDQPIYYSKELKNVASVSIITPQRLYVNGNMDFGQGGELNISATGPVDIYVLNDFILGQGATLTISASASVRFWVYGNVHILEESRVMDLGSSRSDPDTWTRFNIKGSLTLNARALGGNEFNRPVLFFMDTSVTGNANSVDIDMKNSSKIYGGIYAPTRDVTMDQDAKIYGSVTADNLAGQGMPNVYPWDVMREVTSTTLDGNATGVVGSWAEVRP